MHQIDQQNHEGETEDQRFFFGMNPFQPKICKHRRDARFIAFLHIYEHHPVPDLTPDDSELVAGLVPDLWFWLAVGCKGCDVEPSSDFAFRLAIAVWSDARTSGQRTIRLDDEFLANWDIKYRTADEKLKEWHANGLIVYRISNKYTNALTLIVVERDNDGITH